MKKVFFVIAAALVLGASVGVAQVVVVDGVKDAFYGTLTGPNDGYLQIRSYAFNDNGAPLNDADLSAKVWTAWDSKYFYLYEEVKDNMLKGTASASNVYQEDEIELKFDPQPKDSVVNSNWEGRLTALGMGTTGTGGGATLAADSLNNVPDSLKQWARRIIPGGYALEMAIDWRAIKSSAASGAEVVSVAVDSVFGMAICQHDNDSDHRQASIIWAAVMKDAVWNTPKYLGTVKFLAGNKLQFIPTNNMTGVTNPIPYDGSNYVRTGIVVDGLKDAFYANLSGPDNGYLQIKSYAFNDNGTPTGDADLSAKVWTAWDPTWFYLYEEVMDDTLKGTASAANVYQEDEIELKFDPQPKDSVVNSNWEGRLTALGMGTTGTGGGATLAADSLNNIPDSLNSKQWARRIIPGGYALELAIKWPAIKSSVASGAEVVSVAVDSVFGMAICQHDNDSDHRQASIMWAAVMKDAVWNTPKYLGTVKFLADSKLQFIPTNNMTGVTNKVPYDGTPFYMRVDGQKDPFYFSLTNPTNGYLQIRSSAYNDNGKPTGDADLSAKVWTAWDTTWFYLYEEVMDDTLKGTALNTYQEDGIELKFDPQPKDSVTSSIWGTGMTALGGGTTGTGGGATIAADSLNNIPDSISSKQWARRIIPGGYALELAIKWPVIKSGTEVVSVAVDSVFGMAINQHDNDATSRQASIMWAAVMKDAAWNTPKYLGTVQFLAGNKLKFTATNNMTKVTNPYKYDGTDVPLAVEATQVVPTEFSLVQNYPNPFNPNTIISYSIPSNSHVRLTVYDMLGRQVAVLVNEVEVPGIYKVNFDGKNYASGVYFYRIEAGSHTATQKMILIK